MRFTFACIAGLVASGLAVPVEKRANTLPPVDTATDESVLQLALYLEHLEFALYTGGFDNFTDAEYTAAGFPAGFRENVGVIASVRFPLKYYQNMETVLTFFMTARSNPRRHHHRHPPKSRLHSRPHMHLPLPLRLPHLLRRPRQHDHLRRHRRLPRRRTTPHR